MGYKVRKFVEVTQQKLVSVILCHQTLYNSKPKHRQQTEGKKHYI